MMEENLPPGFRFHPTDEELITYYLTNKVSDFSFTSRAIADVDINKCEPWDLPGKASMGEKEWYFFNMRDRKYPTGLRTNRATEAGYWKTTGKDKEIFRGGVLVGMKKTLVFYRGRAPKGEKTNWVMHEYRLESKLPYKPSKEEWVVCRVFQKSITVKKPQQTSSSPQSMESPCDTNTLLNDLADISTELQQNAIEIGGTPLTSLTNFSLQNLTNDNINLNWAAQTDAANALASLAWPSNLLNPNNLSMNTWLLRALQLRNYQQQREVNTNTDYSSLLAQGIDNTLFGNDINSSFAAASSSRVVNQSLQQQLPEEQPYNLDSGSLFM